jgi:chorismate mutase
MRERCPKVAKEGYVNVLSDLIKDAKHSAGKLDIEFSKREERKMKRWQAQAEKQFISYIKKELINSGFVGKILR